MTDAHADHQDAPGRDPDAAADAVPAEEGREARGPTASAEPTGPTRSGFVAILGKPNVGKSTLLNTLLGVKVAPITPKPQTTRRGVRGIYTQEDRQLVFVDTPGLHRQGHSALDDYMRREIRDAVADVDVALWVVDLRHPPTREDRDVARMLHGLPGTTHVLLIGNKVDAAKYPDEALGLYRDLYPEAERCLSISALNDPKAVYALRDDLLETLPEAPFYFPSDIRSDQSREQWVAEIVRESAMIHLRQELPYAVAVLVIDWRDPEGRRRAHRRDRRDLGREGRASAHRHRPGGEHDPRHRGSARKQLEIFLDHRVFLELEVVVKPAWREDRGALRELGYEV